MALRRSCRTRSPQAAQIRRCSDVGTTPIVPTLRLFRPRGLPARPEEDRPLQVGTIPPLARCIALWLGHDPIATAHLYVLRRDAERGRPSPKSPPSGITPLLVTSRPSRWPPSPAAGDCSDLLTAGPLTGQADRRSRRNNHEVGTIGVVPTSGQRRIDRASDRGADERWRRQWSEYRPVKARRQQGRATG